MALLSVTERAAAGAEGGAIGGRSRSCAAQTDLSGKNATFVLVC